MVADKEKEEIVVKAPSRSVVSQEKKAEKTTVKALEEERFGVLQIPKKIGKYLGVTVMGVGFLLICLFAYMSGTGQANGIILSPQTTSLSYALWLFVGLINIIIGFLLMGSE